ncbi:hypothetical protein Sjap_005968 [Stephania japonica]|uniref:Uncharacterized protein n=1 Tax=Stephania japonica TaxID=461633 RepID=A0AAP0PLL1_9MAGN
MAWQQMERDFLVHCKAKGFTHVQHLLDFSIGQLPIKPIQEVSERKLHNCNAK